MKGKNKVIYRIKDKHVKSLLKNPNTFWNGVEEISNEGFYKCDKLTSIVVPSSVNKVSTRAFYKCANLKNVIFEEGIETIQEAPFYFTSNIESVTFPGSAKIVPANFCVHQRELINVTINDGVEKIEDKAFNFCDKLIKIELPKSIKSLGKETFAYCHNLVEIELPTKLEKIEEACFQGDENLEKIHIGENVRQISEYTFADCIRLENINMEEGISYIGRESFRNVAAEKIIIPGSVKVIEEKAFCGCYNLREVILKEGVKKIGFNIFEDCPRIEKIVLPSSLEEIGKLNFENLKFNFIYKTINGETILSKLKEQGKDIKKEYSLRRLNTVLNKYDYNGIIMNEDKLDEMYEIVDKFEKESIKMPSKMFENFEELKTFVDNSNLFNYNRLLIKLANNYDEYDISSIMKFANSIGMFNKSNVLVKHDGNLLKANELAYTSIKEALKLGIIKRNELFKKYNSKNLNECCYDEEKLLQFAKSVMEHKKLVAIQKNKR